MVIDMINKIRTYLLKNLDILAVALIPAVLILMLVIIMLIVKFFILY